MAATPASVRETDATYWWVYLVTGVLWLVLGFAILNGGNEITTVWTIAILAGVLFLAFGFGELATAVVAEGWRWLHILLGVGGILAGIIAFAWPDQTFLTLAAIVGWYLLFTGMLHIGASFSAKGFDNEWWIMLVVGVAEVLIAFWAISYPGRSIRLLVIWVAAAALCRGTLQIVRAVTLRSARSPAVAV